MTQFERIKGMTIEEMAEFFAVNKYPNFPSSPCYVCEYDEGLFCGNANCSDEYKAQVYKEWLESKYVKDFKDACTINMYVEDCESCGFCEE